MPSKASARPDRMRVGVLGAGAMGQKHLEAWHALGIPVVGVYSRKMQHARAAAMRYQIPAYDGLPALLRDVEIADICLPTFLHRTVAEEAARIGCQIVCEKPLALRPEDGEAIFRACDAAKVRLFVAMVVRFFPAYRAAAETVRSGALGAVEEISLRRIVTTPPEEKAWFADESLSGGMIFDLLIHDIDYALWLAGNVWKVEAALERNAHNQYARLTLNHTSGATTRIEGGWIESIADLSTAVRVVCSGGKLEITPDLPSPFSHLPDKDPYVEQLRHFQTSLENNLPFEVTREEVLRALRVAAAARESTQQGHPVAVALDADYFAGLRGS